MQQKTGQWFLVTGLLTAMVFLNHGVLSDYIPTYGVALISAIIAFAAFLYTKSIYSTQKLSDQNILLENKNEILNSINSNVDALAKRIDSLNDEMNSNFKSLEQGLEAKFTAQEQLISTQFNAVTDLVSKSTDTLQMLLNEKIATVLKTQEENTTTIVNQITEGNRTLVNKLEETQIANRELMHKRSDLVIETVQALKADVENYNESLNAVIDANNVSILSVLQKDKIELTDKVSAMQEALIISNNENKEAVSLSKEAIIANEIGIMDRLITEILLLKEVYTQELSALKDENNIINQNAEAHRNDNFIKVSELIVDKTTTLVNALNILKEESTKQTKETISAGEQNRNNIIELFRNEMSSVRQEVNDTKTQNMQAQQETIAALESTKVDLLADIMATDNNLAQALDNQMKQLNMMNTVVREDIMNAKDAIVTENVQALSDNQSKIEKQFEESKQVAKNTVELALKNIEELQTLLNEKHEITNAKSTAMNDSITAMKSDVSKQFENVLDQLDDNAEARDRKHNQLFKQTQDFSRAVDNELRKLKFDVLNGQKELTKQSATQSEKIVHLQSDVKEKQHAIDDIYAQVTIQQNAMLYILDELQRKVAVVDDIMDAMKKMSGDKIVVSTDKGFRLDPNRVEEITDQGSGMTVAHIYNNGQIVSSKMKKKDKVVYERNYEKNGTLKNAKSYNNKGQVVTELTYWSNGQVKERIEWFDKNGSKQKNVTKYNDKGQVLK